MKRREPSQRTIDDAFRRCRKQKATRAPSQAELDAKRARLQADLAALKEREEELAAEEAAAWGGAWVGPAQEVAGLAEGLPEQEASPSAGSPQATDDTDRLVELVATKRALWPTKGHLWRYLEDLRKSANHEDRAEYRLIAANLPTFYAILHDGRMFMEFEDWDWLPYDGIGEDLGFCSHLPCRCRGPSSVRMSHSGKNPGKRYLVCHLRARPKNGGYGGTGCNFWKWVEDSAPKPSVQLHVITPQRQARAATASSEEDLLTSSSEEEEEEDLSDAEANVEHRGRRRPVTVIHESDSDEDNDPNDLDFDTQRPNRRNAWNSRRVV